MYLFEIQYGNCTEDPNDEVICTDNDTRKAEAKTELEEIFNVSIRNTIHFAYSYIFSMNEYL